MAVIITSQEDIDAYFESPAVNQSSLKDLEGGLGGFLAKIAKKAKDKEENKPTPEYFLVGGAVDTILTGEEGEFEKQFYVSNLTKKPSEVEMAIVTAVFDEMVAADVIDQVGFEDCYDSIIIAADEVMNDGKKGWQNNWKTETRFAKLVTAGTEYFEDLKKSIGKKILDSETRMKIDRVSTSLRNNDRTAKYFDRGTQAQFENIDFYYQLPIYFSYKGVDCKALMDLVVVHKDDKGNIIKIEPIDLKTMSGNTLDFVSKIKQHRYDIQAAWYTQAIIQHFNVSATIVELFKFVVESTTNVGTPLVFKVTPELLAHGQTGSPAGVFKATTGGRELHYPQKKGFVQLMEDYIYYQNQGFQQDKILDKIDIILIDWNKGIVE
jgi:hypothetical protein